MTFEARWTRDAVEDLRAIGGKSADRITRKVVWFCQQSKPLRFAESLTGPYAGVFRFRIGEYRILFELNRGKVTILVVLRVKHRRQAYR